MTSEATKPKQILIVDDEPTIRLGFAITLRTESYLVETATNGREALQKLADHSFDLIILDLRMPELDGIETLQKLRQAPHNRNVPVILCSAQINFTNLVKALNFCCFHFLSKPTRPSELREAVANVFAPEIGSNLEVAKTCLSQGKWSQAIHKIEQIDEFKNGQKELLRVAQTLSEGHSLTPEAISPEIISLLVA